MPAQKTNWKKERGRLQEATPTLTQDEILENIRKATTVLPPTELRTILESGTRNSVGNTGPSYASRDQILEAMDTNLRHRGRHQSKAMQKRVEEAKKRNPKSIKDRLKGLFGGG